MEAIIFIGIQATGKSTFYRDQFFQTHLRISLDLLKTRAREKQFFETCLQTKQKLVIDNTNPRVEDRQRYIPAAKAVDFKVVGYYFESKIADALKRNQQRMGKQRIPEPGILATYNKLMMPTFNEGFDQLYYVGIGEDGNFNIEEWRDEI
ncbi:MAG: AAA family ATPase [Chloroflexota bacterium]